MRFSLERHSKGGIIANSGVKTYLRGVFQGLTLWVSFLPVDQRREWEGNKLSLSVYSGPGPVRYQTWVPPYNELRITWNYPHYKRGQILTFYCHKIAFLQLWKIGMQDQTSYRMHGGSVSYSEVSFTTFKKWGISKSCLLPNTFLTTTLHCLKDYH